MKRRPARAIHAEIPSWPDLTNQHQFDALPATTRAAHAHTPILFLIASKDKITTGQSRRQRIPLYDREAPRWQRAIDQSPPPAEYLHTTLVGMGGARKGSPSKGSLEPVPRRYT
jgi:hypothetical protein